VEEVGAGGFAFCCKALTEYVNTAYKRTVYAGVTYLFDRRRLLTSAARLAASSVLVRPLRAFAFSSENACALTPELETGPFYIPSELVRQDIRESKPGVPLRLRIRVVDVTTCKPVKGAAVDIWHCDAAGVYSGYTSSNPDGFGGPGGPPHLHLKEVVRMGRVGLQRCSLRTRKLFCAEFN
jgi:hypothetical protein